MVVSAAHYNSRVVPVHSKYDRIITNSNGFPYAVLEALSLHSLENKDQENGAKAAMALA